MLQEATAVLYNFYQDRLGTNTSPETFEIESQGSFVSMFQLFLNRYSGIPRLESRLTAAAKAGYDTVYLPAAAYPAAAVKNGPPVFGQRLF
jgi:hypothetical protein